MSIKSAIQRSKTQLTAKEIRENTQLFGNVRVCHAATVTKDKWTKTEL